MKKIPAPILLVLLICGAACAQALLHPQFKSPIIPQEQVTALQDLSWANRAWSGDNTPYKQIRDSINTAVARGRSADDLRQQYGIAAQQKPNDPAAQFAWGYAAWIASRSRTITDGKSYDDLWGVREAMAHVPDPHTYDFYRLRFLLAGGPKLLPLSNHLLTVDPKDMDVKAQAIRINPDAKATLAECNALIEAYPQSSRYRGLLGNIYFYSWTRVHDEHDRLQAIKAYDDYLKLSLPNDRRLGDAHYLLKLLAAPAK